LLREDLAIKRALAAAVLYNLSLLSFILCFFLFLFISWFFVRNLLFFRTAPAFKEDVQKIFEKVWVSEKGIKILEKADNLEKEKDKK